MKRVFKSIIVASVLATAGYATFAQPAGGMGGMGGSPHPMMGGSGPMGTDGGMGMGMRGRMDPARMEAFVAKRAAELKTKLKITAAQEGAWTTFTAAMKPPTPLASIRPDRAEMDKLSTPERIDKMHALRVQHMAERNAAMDKREVAVKTFYAVLTPEQQKTFDAEHSRLANGKHHGWNRGSADSGEKPVKK